MLAHLRHARTLTRFAPLTALNVRFFAKDAKTGGAGKKDDKAAPAEPVVEAPKME